MKLISFGSGSCGNCYYIESDGRGVVIDAGIGIRKLKKYFGDYGVNPGAIEAVLVTHDHADHVKSVGMLSAAYGLPVYATARVHEGIRRNYCVRRKVDPACVVTVAPGAPFAVAGLTIEPFAVPHDSLDNVGYKITAGMATLSLITDAGRVTPAMADAVAAADYLIIESNYDEDMLWAGRYPVSLKRRVAGGDGHLSNGQCAAAVAAYASDRLRHVWLCHLSADNNRPDVALAAVRGVLAASGRPGLASLPVDVMRRGVAGPVYELGA